MSTFNKNNMHNQIKIKSNKAMNISAYCYSIGKMTWDNHKNGNGWGHFIKFQLTLDVLPEKMSTIIGAVVFGIGTTSGLLRHSWNRMEFRMLSFWIGTGNFDLLFGSGLQEVWTSDHFLISSESKCPKLNAIMRVLEKGPKNPDWNHYETSSGIGASISTNNIAGITSKLCSGSDWNSLNLFVQRLCVRVSTKIFSYSLTHDKTIA